MAITHYQQTLELLDKLSRDEQLQLINAITERLREDSGTSQQPEEDEPEEGGKRKNYPKLGAMLEWGLVQLRDTLYVEGHPDEPALLLDKNTVAYRGQEMRINDWGCRVSGWSSISIYRSVFVKRLGKTLGQIRMQYMTDHDMLNSG